MLKKLYILFIIICIGNLPMYGQVDFNKRPDDDLGNVEDEFQEHFFEALKQKGIENYDRAVAALHKCLNLNSKRPVIYFELGKNYNQLKKYNSAVEYLKKAISMQPDNVWFLDELYDVYVQQDDVNNAIITVEQLVEYHPDYKEDLATLYVREQRYKEALDVLDALDKELGYSPSRNDMRNTIYNSTGNSDGRIANLKQRIASNPNTEDNYLQLIYRYSQSGNKEEAYKTAVQLLKVKPDSKLVHLALYKFYLEDNKIDQAITSIKTALKSDVVDANTKIKALKDFVNFVSKNPQYEKDLIELTSYVNPTNEKKTLSNLGQYYVKTGDNVKALENYKKALQDNPNDFNIIKKVLLLQLNTQKYEAAIIESQNALELYPAQPILYLVNGVANNKLANYTNAIENLEMGLEFLIENPKMEIDFYSELGIAYKGINNISKSEAFVKKAEALKEQ